MAGLSFWGSRYLTKFESYFASSLRLYAQVSGSQDLRTWHGTCIEIRSVPLRRCAMHRIAIIGAGFSGSATAIQLLRRAAPEPFTVTLINRHPELARGVAYGTHSPSHLLNVPAGRMSLFPDEEGDFLRYAQGRDQEATGGSFMPRSLYGEYLGARLQEAAAHSTGKLETLTAEVTDLRL